MQPTQGVLQAESALPHHWGGLGCIDEELQSPTTGRSGESLAHAQPPPPPPQQEEEEEEEPHTRAQRPAAADAVPGHAADSTDLGFFEGGCYFVKN